MPILTALPSKEQMMFNAETLDVSVRPLPSLPCIIRWIYANFTVNACQRGYKLSLDKTKCIQIRKRSITARAFHS